MRATRTTILAILAIVVGGAGCGDAAPQMGAWMPMQARQVGVELEPGQTVVEIRDTIDGWTERVAVVSDGRTVVSGLSTEQIRITPNRASPREAEFLRTAIGVGRSPEATAIERAYALCLAVGSRAYSNGAPRRAVSVEPAITADTGHEVLEGLDAGGGFNCLSLATLFVDAARAHGLVVRRVDLAVRDGSPYEGHSVAEVWDPERGAWVMIDPTFGLYYTVDGRPASTLDVHRAVVARRTASIGVVRARNADALDPWATPINPLFYFRNVYLAVDGGSWLRFAGAGAPPSAIARRGFVQTDSHALFALPPEFDGEVPILLERSNGRIVAQALDGRLVVCLEDGLFEPGRFMVRSSSSGGLEFTKDLEGYDERDTLLWEGENVAPNPTFADADGDDVPDGWELDAGSPRFSWTGAGELVVETGDEPARLSSAIPGAEAHTLGVTLRARVDRGALTLAPRKRRAANSLVIMPGALLGYSPNLLGPSTTRFRLRLDLAPHSRVLVESLSIRRERPFGAFVSSAVEPDGTEVALLHSSAVRAPVSNSRHERGEQGNARRDDDNDGKRDDGRADGGAKTAVSAAASGEARDRVRARTETEVRGAAIPGRGQARGARGPGDRW